VEQLQAWFWKACLSNRFSSTVESRIEEDCEAFDKILDGESVEFPYQIDWETFKTRLIAQDYNLRNAFCKPTFVETEHAKYLVCGSPRCNCTK
jgi:hypothetical protein